MSRGEVREGIKPDHEEPLVMPRSLDFILKGMRKAGDVL